MSLGSLGPVRVGYVAAAFVTMGAAVALTHHVLYLNLVAPSLARGEGVSIATWALVVAPVVLAAIALGVPIRGGAELIAAALAGELARGAYVAWASRAGLPPFGARPPEFRVDAETDPDLVVGVRQVFAGQLTLLDRQLGLLIDAIGGATGAEGWTVLVAGVRGLSLGLHGWVGCGGDAVPFGETVHVPAVLVDARGRSCGQRYGGLVVPADLGVTLCELAAGDRSAEPPAGRGDAVEPGRGRSLVPLLETWSLRPRDRVVVTGRAGRAVVTPAWHLLMEDDAGPTGPRARLFAKPDDYFELSDVANRCPAVIDALR